jgi:hypothetical protein
MSSDSDLCAHCSQLHQDFCDLQEKATRLQRKIESLQASVSDLTIKNQILANENKLLQLTKPQIVEVSASNTILTSKVSQILTDFDLLFENQNKDLSALLSDRDRLASSCFSLLSLVTTQESLLARYRSATSKLLSFIDRSGESPSSVTREFAILGIDASQAVNLLQQRFHLERVCACGGELIQDEEVIRVLNQLPLIGNDSTSLEIVANYVRQQIDSKNALKEEIVSEQRKTKGLAKELNRIAKVARLNVSDVPLPTQLAQKLEHFRVLVGRLKVNDAILRESVNVILQFAARFEDDINMRCCVTRMKRWIGNPEAVDIVQEINFILGLFPLPHPGEIPDSGFDRGVSSRLFD